MVLIIMLFSLLWFWFDLSFSLMSTKIRRKSLYTFLLLLPCQGICFSE